MAAPIRGNVPTPESDVGPGISGVFGRWVAGDAGASGLGAGDGVEGDGTVKKSAKPVSNTGLEPTGVGSGVASEGSDIEAGIP